MKKNACKKLHLQAPAKLNLWLKILGRRPDGFHELDTLLCPVSLYDYLALELVPGQGFSFEMADVLAQDLPADSRNLVWRAAELFFNGLSRTPEVKIKLTKNIPAGAGLGGGSSDAAAVLYGLNVLHAKPYDDAALAQLALKLGADVPFFLQQGPARAKGIGEKLTPWPGNYALAAVIVFPNAAVATANVYQNYKLALTNAPKNSICESAENKADWPDLGFELQNDLESAAISLCPTIAGAKKALQALGLKHVLMSGSGSAVFGLCPNITVAQQLVTKLKIKSGWRVFTVEILNRFGIVL